MIVYELATERLDTELFPQHTIADLNFGIKFIVLLSRDKPLLREGINTHTHTHRMATEVSRKSDEDG